MKKETYKTIKVSSGCLAMLEGVMKDENVSLLIVTELVGGTYKIIPLNDNGSEKYPIKGE